MKKIIQNYVAYYSPASHKEWTKLFKYKREAEEYVKSKNCWICKEDGLSSMCASEWLIVPYDKYLKAKNHGDLMKVAGWKRIK